MGQRTAREARNVYWLGGEEQCVHCLQSYSQSIERICAACDGPACPHCVTVVHETSEVICSGCGLEAAETPAGKSGGEA